MPVRVLLLCPTLALFAEEKRVTSPRIAKVEHAQEKMPYGQ